MRANPIRSLMLLAAMAVLALAPVRGAAQDFPTRPVRFIVPYAAGGSGDLLARLLGNKLAAIWGQQVVVDNRAGGGGLIGTEFAARSDPDGYTLYLATDGPLTVAAGRYKRVPYDWKRDLAPVSMLAMGYQVLIVKPALPARSVQELIALARQKPGELNYASIGIGSAPHLGAELFKFVAKVDITHVPYRGSSAQAISALLAGDVAMFLVGTSTAVPHTERRTARPCRHRKQTRGRTARGPDFCGSRIAGRGREPLVRRACPERHAGIHRQEAQCRHRPGRRRSGVQTSARRARVRRRIEQPGGTGAVLRQGLCQVS